MGNWLSQTATSGGRGTLAAFRRLVGVYIGRFLRHNLGFIGWMNVDMCRCGLAENTSHLRASRLFEPHALGPYLHDPPQYRGNWEADSKDGQDHGLKPPRQNEGPRGNLRRLDRLQTVREVR